MVDHLNIYNKSFSGTSICRYLAFRLAVKKSNRKAIQAFQVLGNQFN